MDKDPSCVSANAVMENQAGVSKSKHRPIVRIGIFLISHSALVSLICCTAGIVALFLLPILAKNTYISENALMPGSANPMFAGHDTIEANQLVKDIMRIKRDSGEAGTEISRLLSQNLITMGAEVYHHKFHAQSNQMRPLQFFSACPNTWKLQGNSSCSSQGTNVVGIIRAPRSDGKEALVLVTPYNSSKIELNEALSLGLAYSVLSLLSRVNWLAKDIVWLVADSRHGEYASVGAWLLDYHTPVFSGLDEVNSDNCPQTNGAHDWKGNPIAGKKVHDVFRRAGTMAAALVIKVVDRREATRKDTLHIYSEASNGQMPNLDLINIVHYLAVHRQGLNVKVEKCYLLLNSAWIRIVGEILELIGKVARTLNSEWKFGIPAKEYIEGTATLASSLYYQALGIPTGLHGAFRDYQVDAITLEISPKVSLHNDALRAEFLLRSGRLLEGIIRSVNNLLEKFHQSFFLYLMTSPHKFVSVGVYMIAFALLVAPLPIAAAALYSGAQTPHSTDSWRWLHSANVVFLVHFWGIIVSLLPSLITRFSNTSPTNNMLAWVSLSIFTLVILGARNSKKVEWTTLKAVMIAVTSIGLCLMSIINYAAAQIGAILIVPLCLLVQPLKAESGTFRRIGLAVCNIILAFVSFPPVGMLLVKRYLEGGFGNVGLVDFWIWAESLWAWNSATYLYLGLIHLPCWVLCVQVLLHPCLLIMEL